MKDRGFPKAPKYKFCPVYEKTMHDENFMCRFEATKKDKEGFLPFICGEKTKVFCSDKRLGE
jgi:hypothetical protein